MTSGVLGQETSIPRFLTAQLGLAFDNLGVIGQTSTEIAARVGALPTSVSVTGNLIPASDMIALTAFSPFLVNHTGPDACVDRPLQLAIVGTLAGVRGYIQRDLEGSRLNSEIPISAFKFTRLEAGAATSCPPGSIFTPDNDAIYENSPIILRMGYNNRFDFDRVVADHEAVFSWNKPERQKILLLDPPVSYYENDEGLAPACGFANGWRAPRRDSACGTSRCTAMSPRARR